MDENEEFECRARAERDAAGAGQVPNYDKRAFDNGPLKIGKEGLGDSLREVLRDTDWLTRNIAGAGSAVVNAAEGVKGLFGKTDADQVANQKIIADAAPVGNIAGNVAMLAPTALIPGANTVTGAAVSSVSHRAGLRPIALAAGWAQRPAVGMRSPMCVRRRWTAPQCGQASASKQ